MHKYLLYEKSTPHMEAVKQICHTIYYTFSKVLHACKYEYILWACVNIHKKFPTLTHPEENLLVHYNCNKIRRDWKETSLKPKLTLTKGGMSKKFPLYKRKRVLKTLFSMPCSLWVYKIINKYNRSGKEKVVTGWKFPNGKEQTKICLSI